MTGAVVDGKQLKSGQDLTLDGTESDTAIMAYHESQVTLGAALAVDRLAPNFTVAGSIAKGTKVDSYLLHMDSTGHLSSDTINLKGTATFSHAILGLIFSSSKLLSTDTVLGVSGVYYWNKDEFGKPTSDRGLESSDKWKIFGNQLSFDANFTSSTAMDEVRVLTAVPEPSTYVAGALMLVPFGVGMIRKLRANRTA